MQTFSFTWNSSLESNSVQTPMQLLFRCSYSLTSCYSLLNPTVMISCSLSKNILIFFPKSYITIYVFDRKMASSNIA